MLTEPSASDPTLAADGADAARSLRPSALPALPYMTDSAHFGALVHQQLAQCRRSGTSLGVLSITVNLLALPQDRRAQVIEAQAVREAGLRLRGRVRATDTVVRVGLGGYGVVLFNAAEATCRNVQLRLTDALRLPYRVGPLMLDMGVQCGFACFPQTGATGEALVVAAERARSRTTG